MTSAEKRKPSAFLCLTATSCFFAEKTTFSRAESAGERKIHGRIGWKCCREKKRGTELKIFWNGLAVGVGGAIGSICRYLLSLLPVRPQSGFPVVTLCINVAGAFCIGLLAALSGRQPGISPRLLLFWKVGICGGFTTFSTFSLEALNLLQAGKTTAAVSYAVLSVVLCIAAVFGAQALVR